MKISDFVLDSITGHSLVDRAYNASVLVTTGFLWWKKSRRVGVRKKYGRYWYFTDTGKFTPGFKVEDLVRVWEAKTGKDL